MGCAEQETWGWEMSYQFRQNMSHNIVFGDNIGTLSFDNKKLSFTGNADESAKIMFDFVVAQFNGHIQKIRADEREACAQLCEDEYELRLAETIRAWDEK
jgi:hypothetical protein